MPIPKNEYLSDTWRDGLFDNKIVFCTGGAGSICSAQVRALVHLGANACIVGRNVKKTESMAADIATARQGAKVIGIGEVDVRSVESLMKAVERCVGELGGIDFTIAGAAGNFLAPMNQLSTNAFKSVMDIDVLGSYNTLKATLPHLLDSAARHKTDGKSPSISTGGRIIFVSATIHYTGAPMQTHVSVAKAGVDALSTAVCLEQGPRGITSNVIAPGGIEGTEGLERLADMSGKEGKGGKGGLNSGIPLGRLGTLRDVADATVYLFSAAGSYVSGDVLVVDGGAWHRPSTSPGAQWAYPDFLLSDEVVQGVRGGKKSKL
ncbi:putative peroxisomal 2,4-dienoyl-CoA reductase SPS19 [Aulographum hederae CBS 113979]|uniref:2,4-dienoyl-CoA reductase [(3E)-enoyl-CoA-producing] n=1 Tax=Aulographum hederae CBS 113979 TaxID=1176131 RepID=A0A6G1HCQ0_9PEZI|nr:putative peroxisomal 2,4-dienoyl-CoA reductase SPS19 [Aulographum hederae CBS 113979]